MPALIHKMPDKDNVVLRAVAQQIQRKRKLDEKVRSEEEARESEKKRKDDERKRNQELQSRSLAVVNDELNKLYQKLNSLKEEKHGLFSELKKVVNREEEEKKRIEAGQMQQMFPGAHVSGMFQTAHNHNQYGPNGRLSILGSRKDSYHSGAQAGFSPIDPKQQCTAARMLTPNSPVTNPYLRANVASLQSRYLKMPASPASPAHSNTHQ